jgi:HAD superfamily hydrolase (TIGR01549 family)
MRTEQMVQAIIFDIDGTLVDSVQFHAQAWQKAFRKFGYEFPIEELCQQIGKGSDYIIPDLIPYSDYEEKGDAISEYRKEYYQEKLLSQVRPFPKVRELFERLKGDGITVVLASSARTETVKFYQELLQLDGLADSATSTDDVEKSKPEPDIFEAALAKMDGINAEGVMVVGDSPYDAIAATKINLFPVGVLCGGFTQERLEQAGCRAIYRDPADILAQYETFIQHL